MKTQWLLTDVTAAGSPIRAESEFFGTIFDVLGHFDQLVADLSATAPSVSAENEDFKVMFDIFCSLQVVFVVDSHFVISKPPIVP